MKKLFTVVVFLLLLAVPGTSQEPSTSQAPSEFTFARVEYTQSRWTHIWPPEDGPRPGPPWWHDWPFSDEFVTGMLQELTGLRTTANSHQNVNLNDPEIFNYPFLYISEPGFLLLTENEIKNLGEYIRRGGFIMADDFRQAGVLSFTDEMAVLRHHLALAAPEYKLVRLDVTHPIFHQFFDIDTLDMLPPYGNIKPEFWGLEDENGKLSMIASYNNDLGDYWEALDHHPDQPVKWTIWATQLGINFVLYAMSH